MSTELAVPETATCAHGNRYFCGLCAADAAPKCPHGNPFFCGFCAAEAAPKCQKHGRSSFCGECGPIALTVSRAGAHRTKGT